MKYVLFILLVLTLAACQSEKDRRLEYALEFAGDNCVELEKVLEHYRTDPEKLEAARFLIRNMPGWYSYEGNELDSIHHLLVGVCEGRPISKREKNKWNRISFDSLSKIYDAQVITAEYLIDNIDLAFEVWRKYPWNRNLPFDDFCELILPYRIADEPLSDWRKLYYEDYGTLLDSLYKGDDVIEASKIIDGKLRKLYYIYNTDFRIPHLDAVFLYHNRIGYCREACDLTIYAMRACGISVATDYFAYSPDYQHYHCWTMLRDTTGTFLQFGFNEFEASRDTLRHDGRKKGKVYRYCFGVQPEKISGISGNKRLYPVFRNRFVKDVTSEYFGSNDTTIPIQIPGEQYIYLGIFSPGGWIPIDMALGNAGKVTFRDIEPDVIYQTLYQGDGGKLYPAGYPFISKRGGEFVLLKPNIDLMEEAILRRKMPQQKTIAEWAYRAVIGAKIEAASDLSFIHADLLWQFEDTLTTNYCILTPPSRKKHRYVRYVAPAGKRMELAELALFKDSLCQEKIRLRRINNIEPVAKLEYVTDGNILTYFQARDTSSYLAYDLGESMPIERIVFSPRNDDNYIWPGDNYELFYQDGINGWKSLGRKVASERKIEFLVPQNALLWLRNCTKGREEQVFIYKNGRQTFTFDL
ncbi:discoidin domain-containing protein [Bacteroides fragilis]|uniref:discoidin domain-containing protein n=1 Tax=Bacteroides fragilis TaxID=817 RepID=UPI001C7DAA29|nr:discoidin domain-containing protein [Bacteroides fragilis]